MLNKIIAFSIRQKLLVGLCVLALVAWGIFETTRLPIDAVPDITDNQVQVITVSPSLGAPDVERQITIPVEQACRSIPGMRQVRSFSRFGLSLVTIVFNDDVDIYRARQLVNEQLQGLQQELPQGIGIPSMAPVTTGLGEIYQYVLRPEKGFEQKYGPTELRTMQDWIVRRQLLGTPGVADVSSFGGYLKQYEIAVDQDLLKSHNLTIGDVFAALEKNNQNTGGAYIEKGPTVLYIRSEGLTKSLDDIGSIVVKTLAGGTPLLIRDIAKVRYGSATRYGAMAYNDKGEVAGAVVMMLKGENSSAVIKRVKARIAEIRKMLPEGVVIEPFLDRTKMVNNAIHTVESNLAEGALIVIFVLVFFLGNLRAGLIVSSVIPLSMLFAIILMNHFGVGGNLMSLGAIDFGLIVDGSVIVVEAILHRFAHSEHFKNITRVSKEQMDEEVGFSTGRMIRSAVFSQVIILIVYLPILSLQGIEGKMFRPMALTIAFAILGAFLLSVTYVPMMSALVLSKKLKHKNTLSDKISMWLEKVYEPALRRVLQFPKATVAVTLAMFGVAVWLLMGMGGEFIPEIEEGDFAVETRLLTGSNLSNTLHSTQQASHLLLQHYPEVEKVVTKIGSAEIPTDPMPLEAGDMIVVLKDKKEWTSAKTFDELSAKMTKTLEAVPGISVGFQYPVQMRFNELMTGARQDVVCKIFGENLDILASYAHQLAGIASGIKGAVNIYEEKVTGMPQVVIRYNREAMARYGLNVSDINRTVNAAFAGQVAGQVYEGEKRFDMVVRLAGEKRKNLNDIQNLMIQTAQGTQIPLSQVASIDETEGVNQVQRENARRRIIVGFNIDGRDVQSVVAELQTAVNKRLHLPREYQIVYGGSFENMNAAKDRLALVVPVALLLIFLLLYFAFGSVKQGLIIYTAIPLSAIGGIVALWLRDMPFSISAGVGFIALFGVAVLNGILLVSEFNRLKEEGWADAPRRVIHASRSRLRALLMTAVVPSMGFIPMAVSTGAGGEVQKPLATVVIGGLIVSTLLTLFVLPVFYLLFEGKEGGKKRSAGVAAAALALLFICMPAAHTQAQQRIGLQAAVDSAIRRNLNMHAATSEVKYYEQLRHSNVNIDQTQFQYEYGQFNSNYTDNLLSVSQSILFPTVYRHQAMAGKAQLQISKLDKRQKEIELTASVKQVYYGILVLRGKRQLLQDADSLYSGYLTKVRQRYAVGETDALELATTENLRLQIAAQLRQLDADYQALAVQFGMLLNMEGAEPANDSVTYVAAYLPSTVSSTPGLRMYEERVSLATQERKTESAKLLPSLNAGYNSATIQGWQTNQKGVERYYGIDKRFQWMTVGVGIPIFGKWQVARIRAWNNLENQRRQELEAAKQMLNTSLTRARNNYLQLKASVQSFRSTMLPNAATIISVANGRLHAGEIGYLDWAVLMNQAIQVRSDYLSAVQQMNEAAFEIEKLTTTN